MEADLLIDHAHSHVPRRAPHQVNLGQPAHARSVPRVLGEFRGEKMISTGASLTMYLPQYQAQPKGSLTTFGLTTFGTGQCVGGT
eukprot:233270-Rhodomonas_salina.1